MAEEQLELGLEDRPIEPESGNPIPPGGIPSDVKDDQTIKASEGEMVIPAHVVRYIGVGKLEKMIKSAESDLAEMEETGRMGQPTEDDEEELPFSDEELLAAVEESGPVPEFNAGGLVAPTTPNIYINDQGQQVMVNPGDPVPAGYRPLQPERMNPLDNLGMRKDPNEMVGEGNAFENVEKESKWADPTGWETKDFGDFLSQGSFTSRLSKAVGAVSGPIGKAIGEGYSRRGNMAYSEILDRLADPELPPEQRKEFTDLQTKFEEAGYSPKKEGPSESIIERALDAVMGGKEPPKPTPTEDLSDKRIQESREKTQQETAPEKEKQEESSRDDNEDNDDNEPEESSFRKGGLIARKKKKY